MNLFKSRGTAEGRWSQPSLSYRLAGVVHQLWPSFSISSAEEVVNNSARFCNFDSGPVTNRPYNALRRLSPNFFARGRSLILKPRILRYGRHTSRTIRPAAFIDLARNLNHYEIKFQYC
jgi:hypothetical protein